MFQLHVPRRAAGVPRRGLAVGLFAVVGALVFTSVGAAQRPATKGSFEVVPVVQKPLGASMKPVTVVLRLSGAPVAVVESNQGRRLTRSEKAAVKSPLRANQNRIIPQIEKLGGQVLGQYQSAYNGIKVLIDPRRVAALNSLPNVVDVSRLRPISRDLTESVPYIGAPDAWSGVNGVHGEGIKIAVIDTGIDYTNADFGATPSTCPGYVNFATASANSTVDPTVLGVPSCEFGAGARVKGGVDFVGDDYNADPSSPAFQPDPHPDANPLDCNGHGSHVAGIAAGGGITGGGDAYTGPYNNSLDFNSFRVGPGVAPKADIYGLRVFGCEGSTNVVLDAIDWAVDHNMDVINMSLGSTFGASDDADAVASTNAAKAGVIVVASSGNDGPNPYMTGSPASGHGVISVAATESHSGFAALHVAFGNSTSLDAINANLATVPDGMHFDHVKVLTGANVLGCSPAAYGTLEPNTLAIVQRGTCARVAKAIYGQEAGAAGVAMINTSPGYPPVEGPITSNPDTGEPANVTIPFLGIRLEDAAIAQGAQGSTATLTNTTIANPTFTQLASFSSFGPADGDSSLKPDITAPGVSIVSAGSGTTNGGATISGTSQASPHVAGTAALVRQAHPGWGTVELWKAAIVNTGNQSRVGGFSLRGAGTGLVNPLAAVQTDVVAVGDPGTGSLSFGFKELHKAFNGHEHIHLQNLGASSATFNVASGEDAGDPHSISLNKSQITVPAHGEADIDVRLNVPATTVPRETDTGDTLGFSSATGMIMLTPVGGSNHGVGLSVPWGLVPRSLSDVSTKLSNRLGVGMKPAKPAPACAASPSGSGKPQTTATATIGNKKHTPVAGDADFYAWLLCDGRDPGLGASDLRAVGVQSFPFNSSNNLLVFAANTYHRWSSPSTQEFDLFIDVNGDGTDDYDVVGADQGTITAGAPSGTMGTFVFDLRTGGGTEFNLAESPTDGSTVELPILTSQLCASGSPCLSKTNPRFSVHAVTFDLNTGAADEGTGTGHFNAFFPAISQGGFDTVDPGGTATESLAINPTEWAQTPALGVMVVTLDNRAGAKEAQLIPAG